ncbi:helix-turn-helix domain-containing protein [Streptomyces cinereospinus]|uniref:Helix-turn-helix domain-containing protein n=1 Tax=Streptomyces cinereospinus TaxID=285561 RepID=A0ABV5N049_9ACTN
MAALLPAPRGKSATSATGATGQVRALEAVADRYSASATATPRPLPAPATTPGPVAAPSATAVSIRYLDHAFDQGGSGGSGSSGPDRKGATAPGTLPRRHRRTSTVAAPAEQLPYRPEEAAKALRIGRSMVYEEIRLGRLQTVRIGRRRLVPPEYIAQYVELLKREAEAND